MQLAIARDVVDVWTQPRRGSDDDRLTQALLNTPAQIEEVAGAWARVRLPDYVGWVERDLLTAAPGPAGEVLAITARQAPLQAALNSTEPVGRVFAGTVLPILDEVSGHCRVALPGGREAWIAAAAGLRGPASAPYPRQANARTVTVAETYLGVPYLWGGGTVLGIDCSALVQLAYRMCGVTLPRDADQQWAALAGKVERGAQEPGDLLFFARDGAVVHVALALGGEEILHSLGDPARGVCIESLTPGHARYNARLAALYLGARRIVE